MADTLQVYESLILVVNGALGGSKQPDPPKSVDDLEARMKKVLG